MLVVGVISVDAYPFLAFSDLAHHLLVAMCYLIVRKPNLEVKNTELKILR